MTLLEVHGVQTGYGELIALHGVSLHVREGEFLALIGSNGAGKTTLMRAISGLLPLYQGDIRFDGRRIDGLPPYEIGELGLIHVPEGRHIFPAMTVREHLEVGAFLPRARKAFRETLRVVFELFPILKEREGQYAGSLSGGEQQMLAIARGLMANPKLLLLDEPTLGLAPRLAQGLFQTLKALNRKRGLTILVVSQEVFQVLDLADRAYVLENGRILLEGRGPELKEDARVVASYMGREHRA